MDDPPEADVRSTVRARGQFWVNGVCVGENAINAAQIASEWHPAHLMVAGHFYCESITLIACWGLAPSENAERSALVAFRSKFPIIVEKR
jgi:hypothetical protein